ncbi:tetratricopeptide repeat protein [Streptobacillus moniliformis]|uniref:TPR repeat-containing protein n=1 Tax=Streptobacillus moniliformis (strain ATCC 14647 / DSM 12112 / NCTC 10651 / 9901) TaxID=519441 RepID=D1AX57_STRM9|nr:hypothetical protein [Streptobacillus moniliformis]ACZ00883.1 hypothetical protein Smon_0401 [Streptobacillus moniliformis DSM 12112]AVL42729.1 hypothetical protein CEP89_02195 [Streptobacillus moniliformis]SQA13979.1 Uncharacterised protein [Streptobacillus moniliformis]
MKKLIYIFCLFLISCSNNVEEKVSINKLDENGIEVEIVNVDSAHFTKLLDGKNDLNEKYFTKSELNKFREKNIDANQVYRYIEEAKNGDVNAINSLSYVYYLLEDSKKLKEILELGLKNNVKEAIFNLALLELGEQNYEKVLSYFDKLPKDYKKKEIENLKSVIYLNIASIALKNNDYDKGVVNLINAYNLGFKELDYEIANIYRIKGDEGNLIKWLTISSNAQNINAKKDLSEIYYHSGQIEKSLKLFEELYILGEIEYARMLYFVNYRLLNNREALKWYRISRVLGIVERNLELEKLKGFYN